MPKQKAAHAEADSEGEETVEYALPDKASKRRRRAVPAPVKHAKAAKLSVPAARACREGRGGEGGFR